MPAEGTVPAARRAADLMRKLAGGGVAPGVADAYPRPAERRKILLTPAEVERILGTRYSADEIERVLRSLGYEIERRGDKLIAIVPPWRVDVSLPADLVEDVIRIVGYDALPSTMPDGPLPEMVTNETWKREAEIRRVMTGAGYVETIHYTLTNQAKLARLWPTGTGRPRPARASRRRARDPLPDAEPLPILNPLSAELDVMRTSAIGSLLDSLAANLRHQDRDVCLFELGRIYLRREADLPEERPVLTASIRRLPLGPCLGCARGGRLLRPERRRRGAARPPASRRDRLSPDSPPTASLRQGGGDRARPARAGRRAGPRASRRRGRRSVR